MVTSMKKILLCFILILSASMQVRADTGTAALSYLKTDSGGRAAALGGAYTALGDDSFSIFYNPAGTVYRDRSEVALSHALWLEDMSIENAAFVHTLSSRLSLLMGVSALLSGDIKSYSADGDSAGSFSSNEMTVSGGISYIINQRFYIAAQGKLFSQSTDDESARAVGGDFGILYRGDYMRIAFSALNLGQKIKIGTQSFDLPRTLRAGISREMIKNLKIGIDWIDYIDSGSHVAAGLEYGMQIRDDGEQSLFLRGGYSSGHDTNAGSGISAGIGFNTTDLRVDYAFTPYGDLGSAHRFSIALMFGERRNNMRETYEYHYRSREENRRQSENKLFKKGKERVADIPVNTTYEEYKPIRQEEKKVKEFTW